MHAIMMRQYGPPEVLVWTEVPPAALQPDEIRIKTIAAAVNHTDLEIRTGNWPVRKPDPFPYVPGVEVVGEVEEIGSSVRAFSRGDRVITMMQGLGGVRAQRPGGYAEQVTVAERSRPPADRPGPLCHGGGRARWCDGLHWLAAYRTARGQAPRRDRCGRRRRLGGDRDRPCARRRGGRRDLAARAGQLCPLAGCGRSCGRFSVRPGANNRQ